MDQKALKILLNAYWSPSGWKPEDDRSPPLDEFKYAKSKGLMFDPTYMDHDQAVTQVMSHIEKLSRRQVADAFLASLSTRRLDWRSALGSFAVFEHFQHHAPQVKDHRCQCCGFYLAGNDIQDLNVLNFERHKWGGTRHDQVVYAALDLGLLLRETLPSPTATDRAIFQNIISAIEQAPGNTSAASLHMQFAKTLKSNKSERDQLVGILGYCGILAPGAHPGYASRFIPPQQRHLPDRRFVDMPYPACWWSRDAGIDQNALINYFGHVLRRVEGSE